MPFYFFHLSDGKDMLSDEDGIELADAQAAREEAFATARDLARPKTGADRGRWTGWSIHVVDEMGWELLQTEACAAQRFASAMSPAAQALEEEIVRLRRRTAALICRNQVLRRGLADELVLAKERVMHSRTALARARSLLDGAEQVERLVAAKAGRRMLT